MVIADFPCFFVKDIFLFGDLELFSERKLVISRLDEGDICVLFPFMKTLLLCSTDVAIDDGLDTIPVGHRGIFFSIFLYSSSFFVFLLCAFWLSRNVAYISRSQI
jgi:hypothetical protein